MKLIWNCFALLFSPIPFACRICFAAGFVSTVIFTIISHTMIILPSASGNCFTWTRAMKAVAGGQVDFNHRMPVTIR